MSLCVESCMTIPLLQKFCGTKTCQKRSYFWDQIAKYKSTPCPIKQMEINNLHGLLDRQQMVFIKGRQIMDIILIANECIESRQRRCKPWIVCKRDIEKVYDHLTRISSSRCLVEWDLEASGIVGLNTALVL